MKDNVNLAVQKRPGNSTRGLLFIAALSMAAVSIGAVVIAFLPRISEQPQVYTDIIVETLSMINLNKTGEMNLFWASMVGSGILLLGIDLIFTKINTKWKLMRSKTPITETMLHGLGIFVIINMAIFLYTGSFNEFFMFLAFQYVLIENYSEKYALKSVVLTVSVYYSILAAIASLNLVTTSLKYSQTIIDILAILISVSICFVLIPRDKENLFNNFVTLFQIPVPLTLLAFCVEKYMYKGKLITVTFPSSYFFIMAIIIAILSGFAVWKNHKLISSGKKVEVKKLILLSTVISIFAFHSNPSPGLFFPTDWHGMGEQMIPWQQVFDMKQSLYQDYSPVSGLFPMLIGFIQHVVLDGSVTSLNAAMLLMTLLFAILTIVLCYFAGDSIIAFFVVLFLRIPVYNRPYMIVPVIIALMLPALIKRRNLWLQTWVFLCFLAGMHYPSNGGAILLGSLPFGIVQIVMMIKTGELKNRLRKLSFYITWLVILIPIIAAVPILLGMAKHVMIYASQTITADGITIFGSAPPTDFVPYIPYSSVRQALYYAIRFIIPILSVLLFVYCLYLFLRKTDISLTERLTHPAFMGLTSGVGILVVSYLNTMTRMDIGDLLARSGPTIALVVGIFFSVIMWKYGNLFLNREMKVVAIGISLGVSAVITGSQPDVQRLFPYYNVGENYEAIDTSVLKNIPSAGSGFITTANKEKLLSYYNRFSKNDFRDYPILNLSNQLAYAPLNLKAAATGTTFVAKSKQTQDEIIKVLEKNRPLIAQEFDGIQYPWLSNYYIYRWMLDNHYELGPDHLYMPADLIHRYYGNNYSKNPDEYRMDNNLGNISSSLGRSIDSLRPRFQTYEKSQTFLESMHGISLLGDNTYILQGGKEQDPYLVYNLRGDLFGEDADFLYLELNSSVNVARPANESFAEKMLKNTRGERYTVKIFWESKEEGMSESNTFTCTYGDGRLLIPLGTNPSWLLNHNTKLRIDFEDGFQGGTTISVKKMEFLKLKR